MNKKRSAVEKIILIYPLLYGLQDAIEREQEKVIADLTSPAERVVEQLIALDNRRIDICNLKVLYGLMERELGAEFGLLVSGAYGVVNSGLTDRAYRQLENAGFTAERIESEFSYLFSSIKKKRKRRILPSELAEVSLSQAR